MRNRSSSSEEKKSRSSEDILRSLEPAIQRVEDTLRRALSGGQSDAQLALALRSIDRLRSFLHKIIEQVADRDLAERAAVYGLVTERCTEFLNCPADLVYPAVLRLCAESDSKLTDGLPAPDPKIVSALEQVLLQVTVTYSLEGQRGQRTALVLLHDVHERQVREHKVVEEMPWENIPDDVRERFLRDGRQPVTFTLYPGGK